MSLLEVSVAAGGSGPVIVLAGEADLRVQDGNAMLLNPRAPVALILGRLRAAETFTVLGRTHLLRQPSGQPRLWLNGGQDQ